MSIGHHGRRFLSRPLRLDRIEFDLDDDHPQVFSVFLDPAGDKQAWPSAHRPQREQLRRSVSHRSAEIGPKGVVLPHEAGRQAPVARGQRAPTRVDGVDGGGIGPVGKQFELAIEPPRHFRVVMLQHRPDIRIFGKDDRQQPEFLKLARQKPRLGTGHLPRGQVRLGHGTGRRPALRTQGNQQDQKHAKDHNHSKPAA